MNIAIIYHDADFDGKLSNEVCRHFLQKQGHNVHSYGWDYGRPVPTPFLLGIQPPIDPGIEGGGNRFPTWEDYDQIYIVDLSVDELMQRDDLKDKIVWIDHHKSAIEKYHSGGSTALVGYRIDGVSACRLCWQWLAFDQGPHGDPRTHPSDQWLPGKQDFVDRKVMEPELIRLAGEYDIFDHRDERVLPLQFGLKSLSEHDFQKLAIAEFLGTAEGVDALCDIIQIGRMIKDCCDKMNDEYASQVAHSFWFEGLHVCGMNIGQRGNSQLFRAALRPEHQACFAWAYVGTAKRYEEVRVSLYHAPGHEDIDLSAIAIKHGGGGHKGACGFRTSLSVLEVIFSGQWEYL